MIIRMRLRAGAAIPGRLSTHPLCPRSPGTGPSEQSTTQQQRRTRLPPAAPTTKSPAQDGISIESHPRSSTEPHNWREKWSKIRWGNQTEIMLGWNALSEVYLDEFGDTPALDRPKMLALVITDGEAKDTDAFAAEMAKVGKSAYIVICIMGFGEEHDRALAVYQKVAEANDHVRVVSFGNSSDPNRIADAVISMVG